jgi:hypothetical protein
METIDHGQVELLGKRLEEIRGWTLYKRLNGLVQVSDESDRS